MNFGFRAAIPGTIEIGKHTLLLDQQFLHEDRYFRLKLNGIDEVDVAIARKLLQPDDKALDLGANIGYLSLHYLELGAREVHAFEPNPELLARLHNIEDSRFHIYPFAISNTNGIQTFTLSTLHNQGSTLKSSIIAIHPDVFGENPRQIEVQTRRIDDLFPEKRFDFIKVDIEGCELDFVQGAHILLSERAPRILQMEIKPSFTQEYLIRLKKYFPFVKRVGYKTETGEIELVDPSQTNTEGFHSRPPNYVFGHSPF